MPTKKHKVVMMLDLAENAEAQWQGFNAKLRNQVRKAEKSGLTAIVGGKELLNDFYAVFVRNMRDLGTPVYAQKFFAEVLRQDPGHPLALNNLAAILVKQGKFDQALAGLRQALPRAKGFKVALNRVCNVDGVCAARRLGEDQFGTEDLEGVVKSNILMVEMARSARPEKK